MKKIKIKVPAKINLTLDILGAENGYHEIESLVASIDIYDTVTIRKRKESAITINFRGVPIGISGNKSNAYIAAEKFKKEFGTLGADIVIERNIPVAAGLGGSSADVAGVLNGLGKLFDIKRDLNFIADTLGSDTSYMLKGGYAVMKGRGERVEFIGGVKSTFYLLIAIGSRGVSTGESYGGYDKLKKNHKRATDIALKLLTEGDADNFLTTLKNDLYESSASILPEIRETVERLKEFGAAVMTGSGSTVYGIYKTKKERDEAYKFLRIFYGDKLLKAQTL
ncbi:MAG: 4-(cytidine 5'-diphospho)-2-C-methyl-D-erythritol kinase [Clostridia bacterium]|nr:4-(cytidine 5'-diphospho)-2-C-methyl-D-erythritol kinase [Clostridia bacterium]